MKIVMLCDLYDERAHYQENLLGKYYAKHGHTVTVIASTYNDAISFYADQYDPRASAREFLDGLVKVIKLPYSLNILNKLKRFSGVSELLERAQPDLIYIHDIHLNLAEAARYKRAHPGCRIIMDFHADYTNSAKNWMSLNILHRVIRRAILSKDRKYIDKIYAVVPNSAVFLHEVYGIPREEVMLLPLAADTDLARRVRAARSGLRVRHDLGIPDDAKVIFTGGKLAPLKETDALLKAFVALNDPLLHVIIVGDSEAGHSEYKRELLQICGDNPRAHFIGWVDGDRVYDYMNASDLAVFPASQSVLWQQALSMGLPLIVGASSRRGNQDPSYMNRYGSLIILSRDQIRSDVIAAKIRGLLDDPELLERLSVAALKTTDEMLNYDTIVDRTLQFD